MSTIDLLVVHHTASPRATTFADVKRWHLARGWRDIGYHVGIRQPADDVAVEVATLRPHDGDSELEPWEYGAHARGVNSHSLGVVVVGNYSEGELPPVMRSALVEVLAGLCAVYGLAPDAVVGHREVTGAATACPGDLIDLDALRSEVVARLRPLSTELGS